MSRHVVKLPDLGEGTVSSEIVAWHVKVGDRVAEDQPMVEMSTDKAVVEMPAPVSGRVVSLGGQPLPFPRSCRTRSLGSAAAPESPRG